MSSSRVIACVAMSGACAVACTFLVDVSDYASGSLDAAGVDGRDSVADTGGGEVDTGSPIDGGGDGTSPSDAGTDAFAVDLVAYYPMNEGSGNVVADVSGNDVHGSFIGSPVWVDGKFGKGVDFDGAGRYIDTIPSTLFEFGTGSFTVSAWVRFADVDGGIQPNGTVVSRGIAGACCIDSGYPGFALLNLSNVLQIRTEDEAAGLRTVVTAIGPPPPGLWLHLVGVRSETKLQLFVNGGLQAEQPMPADYSVNGSGYPLKLGASGGFPAGKFLVGTLDEVRIYKRALSAAEVAALYAHVP